MANNTLEKQLTSLEVDVITKRILEKQLVVTYEVVNNFFQIIFLQDEHHGFLEDAEVTLLYKIQAYDPTKTKYYYWVRTLKTLHPDGLSPGSGC